MGMVQLVQPGLQPEQRRRQCTPPGRGQERLLHHRLQLELPTRVHREHLLRLPHHGRPDLAGVRVADLSSHQRDGVERGGRCRSGERQRAVRAEAAQQY